MSLSLRRRSGAAAAGAALLALTLVGCASAEAAPAASEESSATVSAELARAQELLPDVIASTGVINAAASVDFAPQSFLDPATQEFEGFEIDILDAAADLLDLDVEYSQAPFAQLVTGTASNRSDVALGNLGDNSLRQAEVDFVDYFNLTFQLQVPKGNPDNLSSVYDLCGRELGTVTGSTNLFLNTLSKCADKGLPATTFTEFPDNATRDQATASGRLPAVGVKDTPGARHLVSTGTAEYDYIPAPELGNLYLGLIVNKSNPGLSEALEIAIQELFDNGEYAAILEKWDLADSSLPAPGVNIGDEAANWQQAKPK